MQQKQHDLVRKAILALGLAVLAAAFSQRALQNLARIDYRNSNFVFFWLAGRMVDSGLNPYNTPQWIAQHDSNYITWRPNQIFPYPLPLALFLAPLGTLSLETAYVVWQILSAAVLAAAVWVILRAAGARQPALLFFPFMLGLLFFGPVYLTLQIGALGAFTLGAVTATVLALKGHREILAGALLSLVLLKPPQGLSILVLAGMWLFFSHCWKAFLGIGAGALALLLAGMVLDPTWPAVFIDSAHGITTRSLGLHSTVFSIAHHVCQSGGDCQWILGTVAALLIGVVTIAYLWRRRRTLSHFGAFSLIIPVAFIAAIYAWSYDQILYVLPLTWVAGTFARSWKGTAAAIGFAVVVIAFSLVALAAHAYTGTDILSSGTTLLILIGVGAAQHVAIPGLPSASPMPDRLQIDP
jgi:hypothetical protein